jgi:hypothetical protein
MLIQPNTSAPVDKTILIKGLGHQLTWKSSFNRYGRQPNFRPAGNAGVFYSRFLCRWNATRSWTRQTLSTSASRKFSIWLPDQRTTRSGTPNHRTRHEKRAKQGRLFFCNFPFGGSTAQLHSYFDTCKQHFVLLDRCEV